jgi:hypothetical protein
VLSVRNGDAGRYDEPDIDLNLAAGVPGGVLPCTARLSLPDDAAMGPGWGGTSGKGVPSSVNPTFEAEPNSLLSRFLWVGLLRIMDALARPFTPE